MSYVYLKFKSYSGTDLTLNTISLKATSVAITTSKTIPSFDVPFSGFITGESVTAALDLGMASKTIQVSGFITTDSIVKTLVADSSTPTSRIFTPQEIAQMIHSGVDSTGIQKNQAFDELVVLIPSFVDSVYAQRAGVDTSDISSGTLIPWTFSSRGGTNLQDNSMVMNPSTFPDLSTDIGVGGFIRSFNCTLSSDAVDIEFSLDFEVATILP